MKSIFIDIAARVFDSLAQARPVARKPRLRWRKVARRDGAAMKAYEVLCQFDSRDQRHQAR
jgi:hypothetical protein